MGRVSCNVPSALLFLRKNISSPMGRVSCNDRVVYCSLSGRVSSPMGRVSCNIGHIKKSSDENEFVPYGACELQQKKVSEIH